MLPTEPPAKIILQKNGHIIGSIQQAHMFTIINSYSSCPETVLLPHILDDSTVNALQTFLLIFSTLIKYYS